MYLGESPVYGYRLAVRAGGHVAARQNAGQRIRCGVELGAQNVCESAFAGFDDGAGVVCDQPAQHGIGAPGLAQMPGAIEPVQAGGGEARGVADVVQPRGGFQQVSIRAENRCQAACPRGDALDVRPAAGQGFVEEYPGELLPPGASVFMRPRLDSRGGTFHGRDRASERRLAQRHIPSSGSRSHPPARFLASSPWRAWNWREAHRRACGITF
jgi:hypothetical protein